jgi:transcriptional regulator with XRE-family HTH domain
LTELRGYVHPPGNIGHTSELGAAELGRRLAVIFSARGFDGKASYTKISETLLRGGISIPRHDWNHLVEGNPISTPRVEVLFAIAEAADVDPDYLLQDDPTLVEIVESQLSFDAKMRALGVERVAARSFGGIEPSELRSIADVVTEIVTELRTQPPGL